MGKGPFFLTAALATAAHAGIIHGVVLENASSRPLARTRVHLRVLENGSTLQLATAVTDSSGQYWFPSLRDGLYLVVATRRGYAESAYGQQRAKGPGTLIPVQANSTTFAEIRMRRLGAIMGRLVDENEVALPDVEVLAYRVQQPLRIAAKAKSDDRGIYRLSGLAPGRYWVRNAAAELEDGSGLLPTFYPGATGTEEARPLRADLDADTDGIDFRPLPGHLLTLRGRVTGCPPGEGNIRVTLSSSTGETTTSAPCLSGNYSFEKLAPGKYELLAVPTTMPTVAAWREVVLDRDADVHLGMSPLVEVSQSFTRSGGGKVPSGNVFVQVRRHDPAGEGPLLPLTRFLLPGRWDVVVKPAASLAFTGFRVFSPRFASFSLSTEAFTVDLGQSAIATFSMELTDKPGAVTGTVTRAGQPVPAAPVYLWPMKETLRRCLHGLQSLLTDTEGKFKFLGLPAGNYLILSSFDLDEINQTTLEDAHAKSVTLSEGATETLALDLYTAP
jgi:protocatechuate 3,4-dioxygenase beta subunit